MVPHTSIRQVLFPKIPVYIFYDKHTDRNGKKQATYIYKKKLLMKC